MRDFVKAEINKTSRILQLIAADDALIANINQIGQRCAECLKNGNKVLFAGNGGSAADSQHLAAEFVSRLAKNRQALAAVALTTDTSILTAIGNDYGFENVFSRQIQAIGTKGDVFVGISTSGKSPNILSAVRECRTKGITAVGFTGGAGAIMSQLCDFCVMVPSLETQNIQEAHIMIGHIVCGIAEREFLPQETVSSALANAAGVRY